MCLLRVCMLGPDWFLSLELQQSVFSVSPVASLQHPSDSHNLGTVHHCFNTTLVNDSKLTKLSTDYSLSVHHNYWIHCLQISPTSQKQATGAYKSIVTLSSSTTSYLITTLTQCLCCGDDECLTFRSPQHNFPSEVDICITL